MRNKRNYIGIHTILFPSILVFVFTSVAACDRYTRIPPSEYVNIDSEVSKNWQVKSSDAIYRVHHFSVTDTTFIIEEASVIKQIKGATYSNSVQTRKIDKSELPIILPLDVVRSIERVEFSKGRTIIAVTIAAAVSAAALYGLYVLPWATAGGFN